MSRREFMRWTLRGLSLLAGFLGMSGLVKYFSYISYRTPPREYDLGEVSTIPNGSRIFRSDIPAIIWNQDGRITSLSLTCSHLGCIVEEYDGILECPCHGSRYDLNGNVLNGPARHALESLRVEVLENRHVMVYKDGN